MIQCFWASQGVYLGNVSDSSNRYLSNFIHLILQRQASGNLLGDLHGRKHLRKHLCLFGSQIHRFGTFLQPILTFQSPVTHIWNGSISIMYLVLAFFVLLGAILLCFLPPTTSELSQSSDHESLLPKSEDSVGVLEGMKNCYYLLTTPKFLLMFFTLFSNGGLALCSPF